MQHDNANYYHWCCLLTKSCPILCNPMNYSLPGYSVHRILQARILERVAISFSRGPSQPRDQTHVSCIGRWILYHWATGSPLLTKRGDKCYMSFFSPFYLILKTDKSLTVALIWQLRLPKATQWLSRTLPSRFQGHSHFAILFGVTTHVDGMGVTWKFVTWKFLYP